MTRPVLAWVQMASCSGCTISFLDNGEKAEGILDRFDVCHLTMLGDRAEMPDTIDLAIIEGAVAVTKAHLKLLHLLRNRSKTLVALGACAENSGILHYALGNQMPQPELDAFLPAHELVDVDYVLPGCPTAPRAILAFLEAFLEGNTAYLEPYHDIIGKPEGRIRDIVQQGLCMSCGMCGATCPTNAIDYVEGKPVISDELCIMCGECYFQCPRSFFRCPGIVDGVCLSGDGPLGAVSSLGMMRATDPDIRAQAQAGGVVSALLCYALEHHVVDGALVASDGDNPWEGIPTVATSIHDIIGSAGTKYAVCPTLSKLGEAFTDHALSKVCVVGLPCQMEALRKLEDYPLGLRVPKDSIALRIGLFCSSNFRYNAMHKMVEEVGGVRPGDIRRIDIGEGSFNIMPLAGDTISIPLSVVHGYEQESCRVCPDFTAEYADIAIGAIGAPAGWSVVVSRSEVGDEVLRGALEQGHVESHPSGPPEKDLIELMAEKKRKRARRALEWRSSYGLLNPFVT